MDETPTTVDITDAGVQATRERAALEHALRESVSAEARRDIAVANKEAAEARVAQLSSLLPDLSTVDKRTLDVGAGRALSAVPLAYRPVEAAARQVAAEVEVAL